MLECRLSRCFAGKKDGVVKVNRQSAVPLTATLTRWAEGLQWGDLPNEVVHQAKRVIVDYLAATIAGSSSGPANIVQRYVSDTESAGPCAVFGTALRFSAPAAALANGTAAHGLELDDGYTPGGFHPGGPTLSAILSAAQRRHASAEQILLATAIGFEVSCRIAGCAHPATWRRGFHNTPLAGVFGAAAGVSTILEKGDMLNALGLAGSHAGGLFEFLGSGAEVKRLHAGKAARDGLLSADLATRGMTGPPTVLEGRNGYLHAFAGDNFDPEHLVGELGKEWRMLQTYVKPYPCCRHLHGPIDAVLQLNRSERIDPESVTSVRVETFTAAAQHNGTEFRDFLDAQMSIPYAVAVTLLYGLPHLEHFEEKVRQDPRVERLASVIEVEEADDCTRDFPRMRPARVTIRSGSEEHVVRVDQPYGEPSNPVSDEDVEAKLRMLAGPVLGAERCDRLASELWDFKDPETIFAFAGQTLRSPN